MLVLCVLLQLSQVKNQKNDNVGGVEMTFSGTPWKINNYKLAVSLNFISVCMSKDYMIILSVLGRVLKKRILFKLVFPL